MSPPARGRASSPALILAGLASLFPYHLRHSTLWLRQGTGPAVQSSGGSPEYLRLSRVLQLVRDTASSPPFITPGGGWHLSLLCTTVQREESGLPFPQSPCLGPAQICRASSPIHTLGSRLTHTPTTRFNCPGQIQGLLFQVLQQARGRDSFPASCRWEGTSSMPSYC